MPNNKIEQLWSILCTNSAIDQKTNNVSLFNVLEEVSFTISGPIKEGPIVVPFSCELVTLWKKEIGNEEISGEGLVELLDPSGDKLQDINYALEMTKNHQRLRSIVQIQGFKVTTAGNYTFRIKYRIGKKGDFIEAGQASILVKLIKNHQPIVA